MQTHVRFSIISLLVLAVPALTACQTIDAGKSGGPYSLKSVSSYITIGANKPWSHKIVSAPEPVRAGESSERFELRHGDCGGDAIYDDCTNDRGRTEMVVNHGYDRIGQESWYGFSIYLDENATDIEPAHTHLFQWKASHWRDPLATISLWRDHLVLGMQSIDRKKCLISHLYNLRGKWMDFVAHTKWSNGSNGLFELWVNGEKTECVVHGRTIASGPVGKVIPHWGIYNSYISNWLAKRTYNFKMRNMSWSDYHRDSGRTNKSVTNTPFKYDWGIETPTIIAYFDEIRIGPSREAVDIRMIEARGGEAVD